MLSHYEYLGLTWTGALLVSTKPDSFQIDYVVPTGMFSKDQPESDRAQTYEARFEEEAKRLGKFNWIIALGILGSDRWRVVYTIETASTFLLMREVGQ